MTPRDLLLDELLALCEQQGKAIVVSPSADEHDLRWMIWFHKDDYARRLNAGQAAQKGCPWAAAQARGDEQAGG